MEPVLKIESLKKYYGRSKNQTKALDGISFQVMPGEFLGIMGSSGSGKSTLLNCIATVTRPDSGSITMNGRQIQTLKGAELADYRGKEIGYLFQNFELLDNLTGRENILLPPSLHGVPERESRKRLEHLASYLGVTDVLPKFPAQMSGGQKQRIAAARALILNPGLILADEPTGSLDSVTSMEVTGLMRSCAERFHQTVIVVTHQEETAQMADRVIRIEDGRICGLGESMTAEKESGAPKGIGLGGIENGRK